MSRIQPVRVTVNQVASRHGQSTPSGVIAFIREGTCRAAGEKPMLATSTRVRVAVDRSAACVSTIAPTPPALPTPHRPLSALSSRRRRCVCGHFFESRLTNDGHAFETRRNKNDEVYPEPRGTNDASTRTPSTLPDRNQSDATRR